MACARSSASVDLLRRRVRLADAQILLDRSRKQHRLLEHDADIAAQRDERHVADVDAVDQHAAAVGIEDAMQQAERRRFARSGRADERDRLARRHVEGHVADRRPLAVVGKGHVLERHAPDEPAGVARARLVAHARLRVEHVEEQLQLRRRHEQPN